MGRRVENVSHVEQRDREPVSPSVGVSVLRSGQHRFAPSQSLRPFLNCGHRCTLGSEWCILVVLGFSCGIDAWTTNSHVIHATSRQAAGPYIRQEELWPRFAHEPNVVRAPTGEWVMTFVAWPAGTQPPPACNCTDGNTLPSFHCQVCLQLARASLGPCGSLSHFHAGVWG